VLIGVERRGVLSSADGGAHFAESNDGFFHRQILALASDPSRDGHILAQLANGPANFLETSDAGRTWIPLASGLDNRVVKRLYGTPDGWWAALEDGGLVRYDGLKLKPAWAPAGQLMSSPPRGRIRSGTHPAMARPVARLFDLVVNEMAFAGTIWYAATAQGLRISRDSGKTWSGLTPSGPGPTAALPLQSVCLGEHGRHLWIATIHNVAESGDAGVSWTWHPLPQAAGSVLQMRVADSQPGADETLFVLTRSGLYISQNSGGTWLAAGFGLPEVPLSDLVVAGTSDFASTETGGLYFSPDEGRSWTPLDLGAIPGMFPSLAASADGSLVYAASATEGVYLIDRKLLGSGPGSSKP